MKIWIVSCLLAAILLSPSTHAQGRGSRRFDSTEVTPKDTIQPNENLQRVDLSRGHRFDTRGQSRSTEVPLEPRPSSRSRGSTSRQDQTTTVSDVNRRSGKDIRLSRNHSENLNQNSNTNEFSNSRSDSRRNNLKESYSPRRTSSRLENEHENLNAKATEISERRSSSRSKNLGREFSSRSSTVSLNEQETLSTRESEISERRSPRRGKSSAILAEVSTEFPSRRQSTISNAQDSSSQLSRTRSKTVKADATENLRQTNDKLETNSSPSSQRSFIEITTFPSRVASRSSDESITEESIKLNPRTRNLNLENRSQASPSRSKSRSSSTDSVSKPIRNSEERVPRIQGRQDLVRSRSEDEVRGSTRARTTEVGTVSSVRSREDISTRTEKDDGKRGNSRTRNENEPRNIYRSRNTDSTGSRSITEGTQTGFSGTESNTPRGRSRSRLSNNNVGTTENSRPRSEDVGRVRSRNENISRGTSRARSDDTSRGNAKSKTEDENRGTIRTRNGSFRTRGKSVEEQNLDPNILVKSKKEELVSSQGEQIESSSVENLNSQVVEEGNLPPVSPSIPNQKETLATEVNNEVPNAQSENPIEGSSSSIGYEVQESTEPILELSSTAPEELVSNDGIKTNNGVESPSINGNDRKEVNSRSRSRDSSLRSSEESLANKEVRNRNEKENKRTRFRSNDSDGVPVSTARGTSRGRTSRTETSSVTDNSRRRKGSEKSNIESQRSTDARSQTGIDEIENSRTFQRDLIERRISSRKKDLTPDQTEVVVRSRFNSKNNVEELTQKYKKDIDTSNSSLRSIRFQSFQERNGKEDDLPEAKEASTKRSVEETLNARRTSFRNKVKEEPDKSNETKINRGRGAFKQTTKTADQEKPSLGKKSKNKDSDDDVDEDANYPVEYIQLKKAGKGTKDILALLMARKKQRDAESKLSQTRFATSTITSSSTQLPRSLPVIQKRIPLDLKTEEDQVQPSIESPITPRSIPSRQPPNPFRDLDPNLANPPVKLQLAELPSSTSSSSFDVKETEQIDGTENIKEKEIGTTNRKSEDKQITEQNNNENNKVKSTRRKSGKYSAQYRRNNVLKETTESNTNRSPKPTRNIPIARNPGRSQNELIARNTENKENEKIVPVTPRFIPSSKTTNVPNVDQIEAESTTPIKPRYQLYMAKDRKKLLDRRLGGLKDGSPTGYGEDLNDGKGYTLGNVESSTEKDGRWKRLKFGAASRPPYNPPRKSTSQLPTYTTTTQKSFSRFKSRKSSLFKNIGETDEIAFEASDDNDPVTVKFAERIDLFSSPPPKLESANLITEIVSTTSNLELSSTVGQQSTESPLLNTVFDGEPSIYSQQMTITPLTSTVSTSLETLPETKTTPTATSKPVTTTTLTTSTISTTTTPRTTKKVTTTTTPKSITSTTTTTTTTPKSITSTTTTPTTSTTTTTPKTTTTTTTPKTTTTTTTTPKTTTTTLTTPKITTTTRRTTITPKTTTTTSTTPRSTTTLKTTTKKTISTPKTTTTSKPTSLTPRKLSTTKKPIPNTTTMKPVSIAIVTPETIVTQTYTKMTTPMTVTKKPTTIVPTKIPTTQNTRTIFKPQTTPMTIFSESYFPARLNSETLLSRSSIYSIDENPSPTVAPRTTRTPSPVPLSSYPTEPTLDLSSGDYVVYGLLPNRTLVRRVPSRTTTPPSELPFVVYGLYPNGTIVKRFPNGTVLPDDPPQETNELVANVDPFNRQELSDILERDRPLAYLYPTISTSTLTTMAPTTETLPTTTLSTTTTVKTTAATTTKPSPTTTKAPTTTIKPTTKKPTTKKPVVVTTTTIETTTIPSTTSTTKPTVTTTTKKPTTIPSTTTTIKPTVTTTTKKPTTTRKPTTTTKKPTTTTKKPTTTTKKPTTTTKKPTTTKRPTTTTIKPTTTTVKPTTTTVRPTTTKKPTTTTMKPTTTTIKPTTLKPVTNTQNIISSTTTNPKNSDDITIENASIQSTTDAQSRIVEDFALLNTLLKFQSEQSGNSIAPPFATPDSSADDDDLANRIIQLAIERAQSTTESTDLQQLASASPAVEFESSSQLPSLDDDSSSPGGKISLWVVPEEEATSPKSPELTPQEEQVLNALLTAQRGSTPSSIRDQILLAELLGGAQSTTKRPRKKKKKPRPATTPRPPPFSGLAALISGLGSGNTQGQGSGLFGGRSPAQAAESDSLDVEEQPRNPGLLVTAAINITKAVSQFMGIVLQGAAQSFQSFLQTRTRALSDYLTYNGSNGG